MHNGDERKTAGLAAKRSQFVCTIFRIVLLHIGGDPVVLPTIECIEKRPKRTTCRSIRSAYVRACPRRHDGNNKDKTQASSASAVSLFGHSRLKEHHVLRAVVKTA